MTNTTPTKAMPLPCAFCEGHARTYGYESPPNMPPYSGQLFGVDCDRCGAKMDGFNSEEEAVATWNTRPSDVPKYTEEKIGDLTILHKTPASDVEARGDAEDLGAYPNSPIYVAWAELKSCEVEHPVVNRVFRILDDVIRGKTPRPSPAPLDVEKLKREIYDHTVKQFPFFTYGEILDYAIDHLHTSGILGAVPEGYVMVKKVPTPEMATAGATVSGCSYMKAVQVWSKMIRAARTEGEKSHDHA